MLSPELIRYEAEHRLNHHPLAKQVGTTVFVIYSDGHRDQLKITDPGTDGDGEAQIMALRGSQCLSLRDLRSQARQSPDLPQTGDAVKIYANSLGAVIIVGVEYADLDWAHMFAGIIAHLAEYELILEAEHTVGPPPGPTYTSQVVVVWRVRRNRRTGLCAALLSSGLQQTVDKIYNSGPASCNAGCLFIDSLYPVEMVSTNLFLEHYPGAGRLPEPAEILEWTP